MKILGNIIWLVFGGLESAIGWALAGLILCLTVIGIPFGLQCLKIALFVIWPFGTEIGKSSGGVGGLVGNILWLLIFGWELALAHFIIGILFSITIIGLPFGRQHFKLAGLALFPFGKVI